MIRARRAFRVYPRPGIDLLDVALERGALMIGDWSVGFLPEWAPGTEARAIEALIPKSFKKRNLVANQWWTFSEDMRPQDLVVVPEKGGHYFYIAEVAGERCTRDESEPLIYRKVRWLTNRISATEASQELRNRIDRGRTCLRLDTLLDEVSALASRHSSTRVQIPHGATLRRTSGPKKILRPNETTAVPVPVPGTPDYDASAKRRREVGLMGELLLCKFISKVFPKAVDFEHVSQTRGDGAGYDLLVELEDGTAIHVEVKTTTGKIDEPFYMTRNERKHAERCRRERVQYKVCRIYGFRDVHEAELLCFVTDPFSNSWELEPILYAVRTACPK